MATLSHLNTSLRFTLSLGTDDSGEAETGSVSISDIAADATADMLDSLVSAISPLFEYSVATVKTYETSLLESE